MTPRLAPNLIGVFDLFRIGPGPASSPTVGPMRQSGLDMHGAEC